MDELYIKIIFAILATLPALIWLKFYLSRDDHPEPKLLLLLTFVGGGVALFLGRFVFEFFQGMYESASGKQISTELVTMGFFSVWILAFIEEVLKFLPVWLVDLKKKALDEPIDAIIYMVTSALGFAAVENIGYVVGNLDMNDLAYPMAINLVRSFTAILLHTLSSGMLGYILAISLLHGKNRRKMLIFGLIASGLLHATYNYFIIEINDLILTLVLLLLSSFVFLEAIEYLKNMNINYIVKKN